MANRSMTLSLTKIVGGKKEPDTGRVVTLRDLNGATIGTATETPSNSGQYTVTFAETSKWGWWYVDGAQKASYSNNSPFWLGVYNYISGSGAQFQGNVVISGSSGAQLSVQNPTNAYIDVEATNGPASIRFFNNSDYWQFGHTAVPGQYQFNYNGTPKMQLNDTGELGINKTNPNTTLDVNGDAIISGTLTVTELITGAIESASYAETNDIVIASNGTFVQRNLQGLNFTGSAVASVIEGGTAGFMNIYLLTGSGGGTGESASYATTASFSANNQIAIADSYSTILHNLKGLNFIGDAVTSVVTASAGYVNITITSGSGTLSSSYAVTASYANFALSTSGTIENAINAVYANYAYQNVYPVTASNVLPLSQSNLVFREGADHFIYVESASTSGENGYNLVIHAGSSSLEDAGSDGGNLYLGAGMGDEDAGQGGSVFVFAGGGKTRGDIIIGYDTTSSAGDVAINKRYPSARLDVNGSVIVTGSLRVTSDITSSGGLIASGAWFKDNNATGAVQTVLQLGNTSGSISAPLYSIRVSDFNSQSMQFSSSRWDASYDFSRNGATGQVMIAQIRGESDGASHFALHSDLLGSNPVTIYFDGYDDCYINPSNGYLGIGKQYPNALLDVGGNALISGSLTVTGLITGSCSSSYFATQSISASYAATASLLLGTIQSASYALTASHVINTVQTNIVNTFTANQRISASTDFGQLHLKSIVNGAEASIGFNSANEADNKSWVIGKNLTTAEGRLEFFNGSTVMSLATGSGLLGGWLAIGKPEKANARLDVSGSALISGSLWVQGTITGSLNGSASYATTASYALTANTLLGSITSASYASTASYTSKPFSRGGAIFANTGTLNDASTYSAVWRAPYACTATSVYGWVVSGSSNVNARKNRTTNLNSTWLVVSKSFAWSSASVSTEFDAGDTLEIAISGSNQSVQVGVQVDFILR